MCVFSLSPLFLFALLLPPVCFVVFFLSQKLHQLPLYHDNSGLGKFEAIDSLLDHGAGTTAAALIDKLKKEIEDETLTSKEEEKLLMLFLKEQGNSAISLLLDNHSSEKKKEKEKQSKEFEELFPFGLPPGKGSHHLACGACGLKTVDGRYSRHCTLVSLEDLPQCLVFTREQLKEIEDLEKMSPLELPCDEEGNTKPFHIHQLKSRYKSENLNKTFHLHPELVHISSCSTSEPATDNSDEKIEQTFLCPSCSDWLSKACKGEKRLDLLNEKEKQKKTAIDDPPKFSIASGLDFGDFRRLGLEEPSLIELSMIAKLRHFHNVVKVNDNHKSGHRSDCTKSQLRSHSILFRHEAPVVASIALLFNKLKRVKNLDEWNRGMSAMKELAGKSLTIELVGPESDIETIGHKAKTQHHLQGRSHVIYQWLAVLQHCHTQYKDDPKVHLEDFQAFQNMIAGINDSLFENTVSITEDAALNAEKVQGDDIAEVRTRIITDTDLGELSEHCQYHDLSNAEEDDPKISGAETNQIKMAYSYVANQQQETSTTEETISNDDHGEHITSNNNLFAAKMQAILLEIASVFNVKIPEEKQEGDKEVPDLQHTSDDSEESDSEHSESDSDSEDEGGSTTDQGSTKLLSPLPGLVDPSPAIHEDISRTAWEAKREPEPINEFTDMQELLVGAFPHVFMFGIAYKNNSLLQAQEMEHLLLQFTNAAATCRELLFYLFDCKSRHSIICNLAAKIRKDPQAFEKFAKLFRDEKFQENIKRAALNPKSKVAKEVVNTVIPILSFGSRNTTLGGIGDTTSLQHGIAMAQRYGPGSILLTVTPDDINDPSTLRFASKTMNNTTFPAVADETFFEQLRKNGNYTEQGSVKIPLDYTARVKSSVGNPVAVAHEFRALLENIVQVLIGCPLDFQPGTNSKQVRTWSFRSKSHNCPHHKGVFGNIVACFGTIETQNRGALHFHLILWGGITPKLLEHSASFSEVCKTVQDALDSMFSAEIPRSMHLQHSLVQTMKQTKHGRELLPDCARQYPVMKEVPSPHSSKQCWMKFFWENILRNGIHQHTFTCRTPPQGLHRCRGCRPAGNTHCTGPISLKLNDEDTDNLKKGKVSLTDVVPIPCQQPVTQPAPRIQRNHFCNPIPTTGNNLMVWELKRPILAALPDLDVEQLQLYEKHVQLQQTLSPFLTNKQLAGDQNHLQLSFNKMLEVKKTCIQHIVSVLTEKSDAHTVCPQPNSCEDKSVENICKWLQSFEPHTVVALYLDLQKQIHDRNGYMVETNPLLHNSTGASTNAILLGCVQQSSCALFYVVPYVCKNKVALEACIVALEAAQKHVAKHPSKASDSGTDKRYAQHLFTRTLNQLTRSTEISDTQVALSLLNMGSEVTTDSYKYFGATHCVNYFLHMLQEHPFLSENQSQKEVVVEEREKHEQDQEEEISKEKDDSEGEGEDSEQEEEENPEEGQQEDLDSLITALEEMEEGQQEDIDSLITALEEMEELDMMISVDDEISLVEASEKEEKRSINDLLTQVQDTAITGEEPSVKDPQLSHVKPTTTFNSLNTEGNNINAPKSFGPAPFYRVKQKVHQANEEQSFPHNNNEEDNDNEKEEDEEIVRVPVHTPVHWWFRGYALRKLTQFEYYALVDVLPLSCAKEDPQEEQDEVAEEETQEEEEENNECNIKERETENKQEEDKNKKQQSEEEKMIRKPQQKKHNRKTGRKKRRPFLFHPKHPLFHSHGQFLRAKHPTLIMIGKTPQHPGTPPMSPKDDAPPFVVEEFEEIRQSWRRKASSFAQFYGALFMPHEKLYGSDNPHLDEEFETDIAEEENTPYIDHYSFPSSSSDNKSHIFLSWEWFCQQIKSMEQKGQPVLNYRRLSAMKNFIYGFYSNSRTRVLLNNFRHRNSTKWSQAEKKEAANLFKSLGKNGKQRQFSKNEEEDSLFDLFATKAFSTASQRNILNEASFALLQQQTVQKLFDIQCVPHMRSFCKNNISEETANSKNLLPCILNCLKDVTDSSNSSSCSFSTMLDIVSEITTCCLEEPNSPHQETENQTNNVPHLYCLHSSSSTPAPDLNILDTKVSHFLSEQHLSQSQYAVAFRMSGYFRLMKELRHKHPGKEIFSALFLAKKVSAPRLLVTGDPGAGKSYTGDTICNLASIMAVGTVAATSYNGIAAVNVDGGTVCKTFSIFDTSDSQSNITLNEDEVLRLQTSLNSEEICALIVDEVSTIDAKIIALLDFRLRQILENDDLPFGGLPVIFLGDFNQLGPVKKAFLPTDMMTYAKRLHRGMKKKGTTTSSDASSPSLASQQIVPSAATFKEIGHKFCSFASNKQKKDHNIAHWKKKKKMDDQRKEIKFEPGKLTYHGCALFARVEWFHLKEQQRSEDPIHNQFVQSLSRGLPIQLKDVLNIKPLSKTDLESSPEEWKFAPILVSTNTERLSIARQKAVLWAKENNTFVFKWKCKTRKAKNKPPPDDYNTTREKFAFFWQFWVPGAPCYLDHNINGSVALVNGAPLTTHSLTFANQSDYNHLLSTLQNNDLPFGTEVEIEEPLAVNMIINGSLDNKPISQKRQQQLNRLRKISKKYNIDPSSPEIILPIVSKMKASSDYQIFHFKTGNILQPIASIEVKEPFPFDLAFAMTVHKAQGRTIYRVVVDLTNHPHTICCMKYAAVFVALSRVQHQSHIRLLEHKPGISTEARSSFYNYLLHLKQDRSAAAFLHGFQAPSSSPPTSSENTLSPPLGLLWNHQRALQFTTKKH